MKLSARVKLMVVGVAAAVLFVAAVAWHESGLPLAYVGSERVHGARAAGLAGRRSRELRPGELAELCALLRAARRTDPFEGPRAVSVELVTADYGRVLVHDFGGPGANLHLRAGRPDEENVTVRSGALGDFLRRLAADLAGGPAGGGAP